MGLVRVFLLLLLTRAAPGLSFHVASDGKSSGCHFPAIFNFGDSNSDTGAISAVFGPLPAPNGMSFFHKPAARLCDGLLLIDHITQELGMSYLHPYLDSIGANFKRGANFAASGATVRRLNLSLFDGGVSAFSLDYQLDQFIQLRARSLECYKQRGGCRYKEQVPAGRTVFSESLYTLDIGQNDLATGFRKMPADQVASIIPDIVNKLSYAVRRLYENGARYFWIHNTGPLGCLPLYVTYGPFNRGSFDDHGCAKLPNNVAQEFNQKLKETVADLGTTLPHAALTYVNVYSAKYKLISHATKLGFVNPIQYCCGRAENSNVYVGCGKRANVNGTEVDGSVCKDPSRYVSWDGIHYSHAANRLVAKQIVDGSQSHPPISLLNACRRAVDSRS